MSCRHQAFVYQYHNSHWLQFENPLEVFCLQDHSEDIVGTLAKIERRVETQGYYGVGWISYEASPSFDTALPVRPDQEFPVLWFALYDRPSALLSSHQLLESYRSEDYTLDSWHSEITEKAFHQAIAEIKDYIAQGDTFQVNYSFRLRSRFRGNARRLFTRLLQPQPAPYSVFIDSGKYVIASASPELFFTLDGTDLTAKPMKGTVSRGRTLAEDQAQAQWLHHSPKNRAENVMIVDMVRNDLGRIATLGSVAVPKLFTLERYPSLWQMTSTVKAQTTLPLSQIIANLFPCASITGAPKPRTMEIIQQLETSPRRIYTGAIGFLSPGRQARFNVAIRTLLINTKKQEAEYGIGSGIVWDSQSQAEYQECYIKASLLTNPPPPFSLLETLLWTPQSGYFLLNYHLQRLQDSAEYFSIPVDLSALKADLLQRALHLSAHPYKIRLLVNQQGEWCGETLPFSSPFLTAPLILKWAENSVDSSDPWLYHKTTYRDRYHQARARVTDCDDILLWNEQGELTESTIANVILYWQGKWITPPVLAGLLPGTFRAWLLERNLIQEQRIFKEMITPDSILYLINSVRGWQRSQLTT